MLQAFSFQDTELLNQWTGSQDALFQFSGTTWQYPLTEEMLSTYMTENHYRLLSVADSSDFTSDGELITKEDNSPRLSRLLIAPEFRGQGHGKKMMLELEALCDSDIIHLFVLESNVSARHCYESSGYEYAEYENFSLEHNEIKHPVLKMSKVL